MKDDRGTSGCLTVALICLGIWMLLAWQMRWSGLMHGHGGCGSRVVRGEPRGHPGGAGSPYAP